MEICDYDVNDGSYGYDLSGVADAISEDINEFVLNIQKRFAKQVNSNLEEVVAEAREHIVKSLSEVFVDEE